MILADAHAHFYPSYQMDDFIKSTFINFMRAEQELGEGTATALLFLTEVAGGDRFSLITNQNRQPSHSSVDYRFQETDEPCSLHLLHPEFPDRELIIISGEQVITNENIELLAIGCEPSVQAGMSLRDTVDAALSAGGLAILPWGVGKWLGKRGRLVKEVKNQVIHPLLFLGDNGSRPSFWSVQDFKPSETKRHPRLLSGTDPLPLPGEEKRVGTFGSCIPGYLDSKRPFALLKQILTASETIITGYGDLQSPLTFLKQQVALRRAR